MVKDSSLATLPAELIERPQWVAWKYEQRGSKQTKPPVNPHTGGYAKSDDPSTWGTYAQALACCDRLGLPGIGYQFSPHDPYAGIDLDKCRDPATGELKPETAEIIQELDSYTEISPSETGVKIWVRAKLPPRGNSRGNVEMYDRSRCFTMTGEHLESMPFTIEPRQAELEALHKRLWPELYEPRRSPVRSAPEVTFARAEDNGGTPTLTDGKIQVTALGARNGEKFARLWAYGDIRGYPSQSEADLALCGMLAFYTRDPQQIDRLFRQSALMRDKWDEPRGGQTYGEQTIAEALRLRRAVYTPLPQ